MKLISFIFDNSLKSSLMTDFLKFIIDHINNWIRLKFIYNCFSVWFLRWGPYKQSASLKGFHVLLSLLIRFQFFVPKVGLFCILTIELFLDWLIILKINFVNYLCALIYFNWLRTKLLKQRSFQRTI